MNSVRMYEKSLLIDCLNELKSLRDDDRREQWCPSSASRIKPVLPHDLCVISDRGELDYEYAIQRSREALYKGIVRTVMMLIKEYGIEAKCLQCGVADAKVFAVLGQADLTHRGGFDSSQTAAVIIIRNKERFLYIFKRFGIGERWPKSLVGYAQKQTAAKEVRFVSLVDERAYLEQINHNEDEDDPTRGTGVLSLRQFFDMHFSPEEYGIFRNYLTKLAEEARTYYGYKVVRNLVPNAAFLYRREVAGAIRSFDYSSVDKLGVLSAEQKEYLDGQFLGRGTCEALTGTSDFASSFMTAEWLYRSLQRSDRIDLAPIVMDYYKAIEQYLFQFLCLHTKDVDGVDREVYVLKKRETPMTSKEELLSLRDKITLSGLVGFFGRRNKRGDLERKNDDLLRQGIKEETYALIVDELESILENRNGYFHKDNLYDWGEVERTRKKTFLIFYLLLGAYIFSSEDENALEMCLEPYEDDFNMLCSYVNECSHIEGVSLRQPVFYLDGRSGKENALRACANNHVTEYDEKYGIPQYSGVCFKRVGTSGNQETLLTKERVHKVEQGSLIIDRTNPKKYEILPAEITIYEEGKYLLKGK